MGNDTHSKTIQEVSTTVIGPTLFAFVSWVLEESRKQGIKRLYFLARDGLILQEIAQIILKRHPQDIECKYLYGSRQAWLIPAIEKIGPNELKWILSDWWFTLTVRTVCQRLGFTPEDIETLLTHWGWDQNSYDQKLSRDAKKRLEGFLTSQEFQNWYQKKCAEQFKNTVGYFKQEGLMDDVRYGLVDVGWRGNQQITLNKILAKAGFPKKSIKGFYLGMIDVDAKNEYLKNNCFSFLFDLSKSAKNISLVNNHLYEAFTSSAEGRTTGYSFVDGKFKPVLTVNPKDTREAWGLKIQRESILKSSSQPGIEKILKRFINNPTHEEAETYGRFPLDGEMTENNIQEIAPVVSRAQFWRLCFNLKTFNLFWVQASLIRSQLNFERHLWKILLPVFMFKYFIIRKFVKL